MFNKSDPYSQIGGQRQYDTHKALNKMAYDMPGYSEMSDLYKGSRGQAPPDYMEKLGGYIDPGEFFGGMGLGDMGDGEDGSFGPLGADQLAEFGEGAYELFDKYKPGMEYIAENQGVGEQELANRLGTASTGYQGNIANQEAQAKRAMGRMGVDPTSGAWQAGAGERAIQGAQGLSGLQQGVRESARGEDWKQRMEAAGIGLKTGEMGTDALGKASGAWNQAFGTATDAYGNYVGAMGKMGGLTEDARQYDKGYSADLARGLTGARPAMDATYYGNYAPKQSFVQSGGSTWGFETPRAGGGIG